MQCNMNHKYSNLNQLNPTEHLSVWMVELALKRPAWTWIFNSSSFTGDVFLVFIPHNPYLLILRQIRMKWIPTHDQYREIRSYVSRPRHPQCTVKKLRRVSLQLIQSHVKGRRERNRKSFSRNPNFLSSWNMFKISLLLCLPKIFKGQECIHKVFFRLLCTFGHWCGKGYTTQQHPWWRLFSSKRWNNSGKICLCPFHALKVNIHWDWSERNLRLQFRWKSRRGARGLWVAAVSRWEILHGRLSKGALDAGRDPLEQFLPFLYLTFCTLGSPLRGSCCGVDFFPPIRFQLSSILGRDFLPFANLVLKLHFSAVSSLLREDPFLSTWGSPIKFIFSSHAASYPQSTTAISILITLHTLHIDRYVELQTHIVLLLSQWYDKASNEEFWYLFTKYWVNSALSIGWRQAGEERRGVSRMTCSLGLEEEGWQEVTSNESVLHFWRTLDNEQ